MTALLALERVGRCHRHGACEHTILRDVSLQLDAGELVAVWGPRHSGRSTLLRVASGIEPPDTGVVRFAGRKLSGAGDALGSGIGFCWQAPVGAEGHTVLEELMVAQLARGVPRRMAGSRATAALMRTGAAGSAASRSRELGKAQTVRAAIARALALEPSLLVIDEPTHSVDPRERDSILSLLRSLADEGMGILMSACDATVLAGSDRALALSDGELRGETSPELAPVVPLRRLASA
jgi:ABC-type multidrug transport system ATPase subunit